MPLCRRRRRWEQTVRAYTHDFFLVQGNYRRPHKRANTAVTNARGVWGFLSAEQTGTNTLLVIDPINVDKYWARRIPVSLSTDNNRKARI